MFNSLVQRAEREVKDGARKLLWAALRILIAGVMAAVGLGFLLFWAYMALSAEFGSQISALAMGLGLILCAGGILGVSARRARKAESDPLPPPSPTQDPAPEADSLPALIAFTAAFVLARYLADRKS